MSTHRQDNQRERDDHGRFVGQDDDRSGGRQNAGYNQGQQSGYGRQTQGYEDRGYGQSPRDGGDRNDTRDNRGNAGSSRGNGYDAFSGGQRDDEGQRRNFESRPAGRSGNGQDQADDRYELPGSRSSERYSSRYEFDDEPDRGSRSGQMSESYGQPNGRGGSGDMPRNSDMMGRGGNNRDSSQGGRNFGGSNNDDYGNRNFNDDRGRSGAQGNSRDFRGGSTGESGGNAERGRSSADDYRGDRGGWQPDYRPQAANGRDDHSYRDAGSSRSGSQGDGWRGDEDHAQGSRRNTGSRR